MTISEIKKSARMSLKGSYLKCASASLFYFIIVLLLSFLLSVLSTKLENYNIILTIIQAIVAIVSTILSYGLVENILALSNGKTTSITRFIDKSILNTIKYTKIILRILLKIIIPLALFILCLFYLIGTAAAYIYNTIFLCFYPNLLPLAFIVFFGSLILLLYFILKYTLSPYIYADNENLNSKEVVQKSNELMKKQKSKYVLLILSFYGWYFLMALILYALNFIIDMAYLTPIVILFYTLLKPYMVTSTSIFFEDLGQN